MDPTELGLKLYRSEPLPEGVSIDEYREEYNPVDNDPDPIIEANDPEPDGEPNDLHSNMETNDLNPNMEKNEPDAFMETNHSDPIMETNNRDSIVGSNDPDPNGVDWQPCSHVHRTPETSRYKKDFHHDKQAINDFLVFLLREDFKNYSIICHYG